MLSFNLYIKSRKTIKTMQYQAQVKEVITILENILDVKKPADRLISHHFKHNRFIGSKDKAVISQMVYAILRNRATLEFYLKQFNMQSTARKLVIAFLCTSERKEILEMTKIFDGEMYSARNLKGNEIKFAKEYKTIDPLAMTEPEKLNYPAWLDTELKEAFGDNLANEMIALNKQADTVIRVNALKTTRAKLKAELKDQDIKTKKTELSYFGLKVEGKVNLFGSKAFKDGLFEMQDEGSQILAILADAKPKQKVLDMCCGAGGKLLAMANTMEHKGSLVGTDINERRLMETKKRLKRAGISNAMLKVLSSENDKYLKRQAERFDTIFVDAPCSGTGTWRRNPDSKWNLEPEFVEGLTKTQASILNSASKLVKSGGTIAYATCSVLRKENHDQIEKFLAEHDNFELVDISAINPKLTDQKMLQMTPAQHNCDGFFIALLKRK